MFLNKNFSKNLTNEDAKNKNNFNEFFLSIKKYLEIVKRAKADQIFQKGDYNLDLIKYAIKKVLSEEKFDKSKNLNILRDAKFEKTKFELMKSLDEKSFFLQNIDFTTIISFFLVVLSIFMIFIHFHFYVKQLNFTNNIKNRENL